MPSSDFPVVFTIDGSSRHEIIMINPGLSVADLTSKIEELASSSPNCEEFMSKYKKKDAVEHVTNITVKWAAEGRDTSIFPKQTTLTEGNMEAVLSMMARMPGADVIDVKMQKAASKEGEEKEGGEKK
ncbi:hypothetical protein BJ546DRAFT_1051135 [Cryomyces antarcticus]|nr:hypothetical protein LTR39_000428 [Cryomyces antarcticus]KAK5162719.1 hypothetical protein LTR04_003042 [Oleoguttula sp. CCFEE 6159]